MSRGSSLTKFIAVLTSLLKAIQLKDIFLKVHLWLMPQPFFAAKLLSSAGIIWSWKNEVFALKAKQNKTNENKENK